jgi:hypothetical protein
MADDLQEMRINRPKTPIPLRLARVIPHLGSSQHPAGLGKRKIVFFVCEYLCPLKLECCATNSYTTTN